MGAIRARSHPSFRRVSVVNAKALFGLAIVVAAWADAADARRSVAIGAADASQVKAQSGGLTISWLTRDTLIGDRLCRRGWVHVHPNGVAAAFTNAEPLPLAAVTIPRGTWIKQDEHGTITVCAFPEPIEIQGHRCRGTGGPKGVQTAFYPSGALKLFFPVRDVVVDRVPCRASLINGWIELHENGRLKSCLLDEDLERDGRRVRRGNRVEFTEDGRLATAREPCAVAGS